MIKDIRMCKQCGEVLHISNFRKYYNRKGSYTLCFNCESVNTRYKYLNSKVQRITSIEGTPSQADLDEIATLDSLFETLRSKGLRPPETSETISTRRNEARVNSIAKMMAGRTFQPVAIIPEEPQEVLPVIPFGEYFILPSMPAIVPQDKPEELALPPELAKWLVEPLQEYEPEYLYDDVYDKELQPKFRPIVGQDKTTFLPIYDDTYRSVLVEILKRFDDFEVEYYSREDT